ncbi:hypothetical protein AnigIFM49718_006255 [Aspergillus niger]|nr:hypothetical protein AnigIFM49718_006255 [Aspergillus niger]
MSSSKSSSRRDPQGKTARDGRRENDGSQSAETGSSQGGQNNEDQTDANGNGQNSQSNEAGGIGTDQGAGNVDEMDTDPGDVDEDSPYIPRYKKPRIGIWGEVLKDRFIASNDDAFKQQFQTENPKFGGLDEEIQLFNVILRKENIKHNVDPERGTIPPGYYTNNWETWINFLGREPDVQKRWKTYDDLRGIIVRFNGQNGLPQEWNFSREVADRMLGNRPADMEVPVEIYEDSGISDSEDQPDSDSDSDSDSEAEGLDLLENRMLKHFSTLTRGKVLYWWSAGRMGTQILVRYTKTIEDVKRHIYRVRPGSSQIWDEKRVEQIFPKRTRGRRTLLIEVDGITREVPEWSRNQVADILGVGWRTTSTRESCADCFLDMHPEVERLRYPPTKILVKWVDNKRTLESREFVQRIVTGGGKKGDMLIYTKAREMEARYWGEDPEDYQVDSSEPYSDSDDSYHPDEPLTQQETRSSQRQKKKKQKKSADKSPSSDKPRTRKSSRLSEKPPKKDRKAKVAAIDEEMNELQKRMEKLQAKKAKKARQE